MPALSGYVFCMSILSGYPIGTKLLADLTEKALVTREQASAMTVICSSSGPLFLLGSVGSVLFSSRKAGFILFFSHLSAILITAFLLRSKRGGQPDSPISLPVGKNTDAVLYSSMLSSVLSVLCVGGFIAVFYLLSQMLCDFLTLFPFFRKTPLLLSVLSGVVEMTGGCKLLSESGSPLALPLCAFLITLGGASILMQQIAYLKKAGIPIGRFLLSKAIASPLAFLICLLFCLFQ